jgi:hypothetical protein
MKVRISGFCAGVTKFTETFNSSKPCESVHTDQKRFILNEIDQDFWMVLVRILIIIDDSIYFIINLNKGS